MQIQTQKHIKRKLKGQINMPSPNLYQIGSLVSIEMSTSVNIDVSTYSSKPIQSRSILLLDKVAAFLARMQGQKKNKKSIVYINLNMYKLTLAALFLRIDLYPSLSSFLAL